MAEAIDGGVGDLGGVFESVRALVNDTYVNLKLALKLDLPTSRETLLDLFDRVRREDPQMDQFRRFKDEIALETPPQHTPYRWLAVRRQNIRSGVVNPENPELAYRLHRHVLEVAPFFLSISALDVEYLEVLFGFDIHVKGNQDQIVFDALLSRTPLGTLLDGESVVDCQPVFGVRVGQATEAFFEVKTRGRAEDADPPDMEPLGAEPVSVYLTMRRSGGFENVRDLAGAYTSLVTAGEELIQDRVLPRIVVPIREAMTGF